MRKPCCEKIDTNKGAWSKQEDQKLIDYIHKHGEGCWRTLPQAAGLLRCGKSCRLRWINYLRPDLKRGNFGEDEEDLIIKLHALLGNRWSLIAGRLPGRTDNEVKNYWNSHLKRNLMKMGIDPNNHRLNQNFNQNSPQDSASTTSSSALKTHTTKDEDQARVVKLENEINNNDGVLSHVLDQKDNVQQGCLPDLNLDLTITFPSSSSSIINLEMRKQLVNTESNFSNEASSILPLFH